MSAENPNAYCSLCGTEDAECTAIDVKQDGDQRVRLRVCRYCHAVATEIGRMRCEGELRNAGPATTITTTAATLWNIYHDECAIEHAASADNITAAPQGIHFIPVWIYWDFDRTVAITESLRRRLADNTGGLHL